MTKLALPDIQIDEIHVAMEKVLQRMRKNLEDSGEFPEQLPKRARKE